MLIFSSGAKAARTIGLLSSVCAAVMMAGCADKRGGPIPYDVRTFGTPDEPTVVPLGAGYKIAPIDTLAIKVFKMADLSGDYEVDLTGQISMPLIGRTSASDVTTAEVDQRLTAKRSS